MRIFRGREWTDVQSPQHGDIRQKPQSRKFEIYKVASRANAPGKSGAKTGWYDYDGQVPADNATTAGVHPSNQQSPLQQHRGGNSRK